jgi:DNA processing protein
MMANVSQLYENPLFDWLSLERIPRVGPLSMARLIAAFGSPRSVLEAGDREIRQRTGLSEKLASAIASHAPPESEIQKDIETLERLGVRLITRWDPEYPENLKEIYDPPAVLFVRGELLQTDSKAVAVVGTRNPTRYGIEMTETISRDLARAGVTVVSGLARGIDTACHWASLKAGGRTIGVLGCGIDVHYPRENKDLVEEICSAGAVMTEFRPGVAPHATNFFRRNRIVSGLSKGVLVVEAAINSGSLITAGHAADQNRDVFAVPGSVLNIRCQGPHALLKQGAGLVESAADILEALFTAPTADAQASPFRASGAPEDLTQDQRTVVEALDPDPVPIDLLCEALGMDPGKLSAVLLDLELRGLVRQYPGKMFARIDT